MPKQKRLTPTYLKRLMVAHGYPTWYALSKESGVAVSHLRRYGLGEIELGIRSRVKLAKVFSAEKHVFLNVSDAA